MRFSPAAIALSLVFATVSSVSMSQSPAAAIKPKSIEYMQLGQKAQEAGNLLLANDLYETSLAIDPRNGSAFIAMAQIASAQGLPGKSYRLYKEALVLNPNNLDALAGQGRALVQRGAVEKARLNLARIKTLCTASCPQIAQLSAVIDKGAPAPPMLSAQAVTPQPTVGPDVTKETP